MRVVVGRIGRAHGVRGQVSVDVRTDSPETHFSAGAQLYPTGATGLPPRVTITDSRWQNSRLVVAIDGISDRTAAEGLRGTILEADVSLTDTSGDEYHDLALVGLDVQQVGGASLGRVAEVLHLPGQDVLSVARTEGGEVLVPFVRQLVPDVDIAGGRIVVNLPDGLTKLT